MHPISLYEARMSTPNASTTPSAADVVVYSTTFCGYCVRAEKLLVERGIPFERVAVDGDQAMRRWLVELTGQFTVPQIVIHGRPIGGFSELTSLAHSGRLEQLLAARAVE